jgi:hypothetical protein
MATDIQSGIKDGLMIAHPIDAARSLIYPHLNLPYPIVKTSPFMKLYTKSIFIVLFCHSCVETAYVYTHIFHKDRVDLQIL